MNAQLILPDQEPTDNVIPFKPNPSGTDENWLVKLEVGTCFVSRPKPEKGAGLMEYHVIHHAGVTSTLYLAEPTGQMHRIHVDQLRFSRSMECVEVLGVTRQNEEQKDDTDGTSDPV